MYGIELPLLDEKGYLAACSKNLAASCKALKEWSSMVRIPPQTRRGILVSERVKNSKWAGEDSDSRAMYKPNSCIFLSLMSTLEP